MDSKRSQLLVAVVPLLAGLGLPATGLITQQVGFALVVAAIVFGLAVILTPAEHRTRHWLLGRLPIAFRSPVYRRVRTPGPVRAPGPLGALDFELLMTQATSRYGKVLGQISKETERSGNVATKYTPRMERVSSGTTEAKIALSRAYARESGACIERMERHADDLAEAGAAARENALQRLGAFPADTDLSEFRPIIETLGQTIDEARASLVGLRTAVASLRANNVQQAVNEVADRNLEVLDGILREFASMRQYVRDALTEIDSRGVPTNQNRAERRAQSSRTRR